MARAYSVAVDDSAAVKVIEGGRYLADPHRAILSVRNGGDEVYLGGADVTTATGYPWVAEAATENRPLKWNTREDVWAICDTGESATVDVLVQGTSSLT